MNNQLPDKILTQRAVSREIDMRGPYFRDQTAIIHSTPFRRMKHKTQVFFAPENDHTLAFSNWPASGTLGNVTVQYYNGGEKTITYPAALATAGGANFTLTESGTDTLEFSSWDGGAVIFGYQSGQAIQ